MNQQQGCVDLRIKKDIAMRFKWRVVCKKARPVVSIGSARHQFDCLDNERPILHYSLDDRIKYKWRGGSWASYESLVRHIFEESSVTECNWKAAMHIAGFIDEVLSSICRGFQVSLAEYIESQQIEKKNYEADILKRYAEIYEPKQRKRRGGYVYLMKHSSGLIKIGYSCNPKNREKTLQAEDPSVHLLFTCKGSTEKEFRIHRICSDKRVRGEWFNLTNSQVDWIVFICNMKQSRISKPKRKIV